LRKNGVRHLENTCSIEGCDRPCWKAVCSDCAFDIRNGRKPEQFGVIQNPPCSVEGCGQPKYTKNNPYCEGHYNLVRAGRDPKTKRGKVRNNETPPECSAPGCADPVKAKGLCATHYARSRAPKRKTTPCAEAGCTKNTANERCAKHAQQYEKYGFCWTGKRPRDKYQEWADSQKSKCGYRGCETLESSPGSGECKTCRSDRNRKGLTRPEYRELRDVPACESCGATGPLVTDHDHSCQNHEGRDSMCPDCIRGRLCSGCNSALGLLGEDRGRILALERYIAKFQ